ncbi:MAG: hypothetical protein LM573_08265 [Thermofilum sp.]|nr:hypothetical protein [Thermofilum sp.]
MDQGLGELEKIERDIDAVRGVESLYLAVLFYGFFPSVLLSVSFSLARGWDASVLIALAFGIGAFLVRPAGIHSTVIHRAVPRREEGFTDRKNYARGRLRCCSVCAPDISPFSGIRVVPQSIGAGAVKMDGEGPRVETTMAPF